MMSSSTQFNIHDDSVTARDQHCRIDLNTAPENVLATFFAVGPARIQALLHRRPFRSWDEVARVPGISQSIVERLKSSGAGLS